LTTCDKLIDKGLNEGANLPAYQSRHIPGQHERKTLVVQQPAYIVMARVIHVGGFPS
jgi:hypothetical protein